MTIMPTRRGLRAYQSEFSKTSTVIEKLGSNVMKAVARKTLGILIQRSPIRTGQYVTSHKVSEGEWVGGSETRPIQKKRTNAASSALATGLNTIGRMKNPKSITIQNTAPYAQQVETGWLFERGSAPGYFVYAHTANDMLELVPQIVKEEEAKINDLSK